ncbi:hypothetical protein D9758_018723 [Tetrapyrgos nigripes]|uniref:Uncharacterized protein n=1 Tax=Tetrapyrgos nigripes TaxID=182062 RepID=A0A8H5B9Y4_9AGAR|nr:hypothetical protein D9758_018723 [Tetrapyrgos nigripes]
MSTDDDENPDNLTIQNDNTVICATVNLMQPENDEPEKYEENPFTVEGVRTRTGRKVRARDISALSYCYCDHRVEQDEIDAGRDVICCKKKGCINTISAVWDSKRKSKLGM